MKCPRCRHEAPYDAEFCPECGTKLALTCSQCGTANAPGHKFCKRCGQPLTGGAARAPDAGRFASPQAYTPQHLAEKILTSKSALEGERKQVTVLFADLKGSMELLADRDPEEARKILDPVLERMMEAVHRYEGTVNQVMGDGIMALFGAPLAQEDHAIRGCYAALRMQAAVRRYAADARRSQGIEAQIRIGLNSGEVVVRSIGSDLHMDYTAVGQTTHLAARMEQLALPGTIRLTADTLGLAEGHIQVRPLGPIPVKGLPEPVDVYELTGARPVRTRIQASAARGLSRFVGRDAELEQLRRTLQLGGEGHGQVVVVVGEPGVGKSRLLYEFTRSHRTHGWLILESGSVSYGRATSYLPVIDLLRGYFKIQDRDDHREIRDKVIGRVLGLDRSLEPLLPALLALLDVPVEDQGWQGLDPPQRRQQTLDVLKRLLLRESQVQPLVLVFEDLHWIDSETQALLDRLIDGLPTSRVLLLVTYRPEYQHGWGSKTYYTQLRLDALPPESAGELLHVLLGDDPALEPLKQVLIARTEGNPFFLEESIRTFVETGALVGERGAYRPAHALETIQVPATVRAVLEARIDRLLPEEKRLLQSASVIGKDVPFALLEAITEVPEEALRRELDHLQAAEFLYETRLFPDLEYTFKHALTHEVAYASLLQERRRLLHARITEVIERMYGDRLAEHVEQLGHHAFRGEAWHKAVRYLRLAGQKAATKGANREAVACFEPALAALAGLSETSANLTEAIDIRFELRNTLAALAEWHRAGGLMDEVARLALAAGDRRRLGWALAYAALSCVEAAEYERAADCGRQALALAEDIGDPGVGLVIHHYLSLLHHTLGEYDRSAQFGMRVANAWREHSVSELAAATRADPVHRPSLCRALAVPSLFWSLAELGRFVEACALGDAASRVAEQLDDAFELVSVRQAVGFVHVRQGNLARAIPLLERALTLARTVEVHVMVPWITSSLGTAYAVSGRVEDGVSLAEEAVRRGEELRLTRYQPLRKALLGEVYVLAGRLDKALDAARSALELSDANGERGSRAWGLRLFAEIASCGDPPDPSAANDYYRQALTLAEELGMRPLVAHCHLGLGKLYRRTGERREAQEHLTTAITMYREMDMRFWLEKAEPEMSRV